jgi:hypothetical protein
MEIKVHLDIVIKVDMAVNILIMVIIKTESMETKEVFIIFNLYKEI